MANAPAFARGLEEICKQLNVARLQKIRFVVERNRFARSAATATSASSRISSPESRASFGFLV